jgi:hypothetical protein
MAREALADGRARLRLMRARSSRDGTSDENRAFERAYGRRRFRSLALRLGGVLLIVVPLLLVGMDENGYQPFLNLFKVKDTEDVVTNFYFLFFIGSILFVMVRWFLTSTLIITGEKVIVRNIARSRTARREDIIDFGHRNWDGTREDPDEPDVTVIRADGTVFAPLCLLFELKGRFRRGEPLIQRAERELVAWYLRVPTDHPSVEDTLNRNDTISGRHIWIKRRYQRLGGGLLMLFAIVTVSPCFMTTLGYLSNPRLWFDPGTWFLCLVAWSGTLWFILTICRPRLIIKADRIEVVNPISRKLRFTQADITGFHAEPDPTTPIIIESASGTFPIYVTGKRRFNTVEGFTEHRNEVLADLNEWREQPWLRAGPASD